MLEEFKVNQKKFRIIKGVVYDSPAYILEEFREYKGFWFGVWDASEWIQRTYLYITTENAIESLKKRAKELWQNEQDEAEKWKKYEDLPEVIETFSVPPLEN